MSLDGHEIFHHKKAAGVIYQAALRAELTAACPELKQTCASAAGIVWP